MSIEEPKKPYSRQLRRKELDLIEFVLPEEKAGYRQYRDWISSMIVIGEGRRGPGNFILGIAGDVADNVSPLASVVAYGVIETTRDAFSITVRECIGRQIDVEIVSAHGGEVPDHVEEKRRWTYSAWRPGRPSPATGENIREVLIERDVVLAIAKAEKRLWVHDGSNGMNLLIPITNFYNELMLHKNIRDPKVALRSDLLFQNLESYDDADLRAAFVAYNKLKPKVEIRQSFVKKAEKRGFRRFLTRLLIPERSRPSGEEWT